MLALGGLTRRRWLQVGTIGLTGMTLPNLLRAEQAPSRSPRARGCILIYLDGGPSHIDLFDLKPQAPAEIRGPYRPIDTSVPGIQLGELLPLVARQMHHACLIRSVRHTEMVHDPAVYQMLTGYKHVASAGGLQVEDTDLPQMGTAFGCADSRNPTVIPKVIQLPETMRMETRVLPGQSAGILGRTFDPFRVEVSAMGDVEQPAFERHAEVASRRLAARSALLAEFNKSLDRLLRDDRSASLLDRFQQQAVSILERPQVAKAFDLDDESPAMRDRYGRHRHGQSVLLARRLIEAGARFVTVYWGRENQDWADGKGERPANNPWDTHRNHFPLVEKSLVPRADRTLATLLDDLHQRGLLDETLVVWMGDFGRTPRISKPWASRDHWPHAFTVLAAGAGIRGGSIFGRTDDHAAYVTDDPVSPADLTATIFDALGIAPHATVHDTAGRPHTLSSGRPLHELFS